MEQPVCPGPPNLRFTALGCSNVLCCVGAINRVLPGFIMSMWAATGDHGLAAALYGPSTASAQVGDGVRIRVSAQTDYPFRDSVRLKLDPETAVSFPLYLRIPGWCKSAQIKVNGSKVPAAKDEKGFARITRKWTPGDLVELRFPMQPRVLRGYETEFPSANQGYYKFEPAEVFQPRKLPYASVICGPLLFALPIPDLDPNTPAPDARWQFALDTDASRPDAGLKLERRAMPRVWAWPLEAPLVLRVPAKPFDWHPTDAHALPDKPVTGGPSETIRLVPYGCTRFRISMFPVSQRAWPAAPMAADR